MDRVIIARAGVWCGFSEEHFQKKLSDGINSARRNFERPEMWGAVETLAAELQVGPVNNKCAAEIIAAAIMRPYAA